MFEFGVRENAGLRRFGYPVRAGLPLDHPGAGLRLLEEGKPVPAQFTRGGAGRLNVDFNASPLPWQRLRYRIEEGAGLAIRDAMRVEESEAGYLVKYPGGLVFEVPRNLLGLLSGVRSDEMDWVRPGSFGLGLTYGDDIRFRGGGINHWGVETKAAVVKQGPLACALRFEGREGLRGAREVASTVELHFPRSKSWVEVIWWIRDPENFVSGMWVDMNLVAEGARTPVDFGAGSAVYAALRAGQTASLRGRHLRGEDIMEWSVEVGGEPYASGRAGAVEGWAHAMDARRATAVAVSDFGRASANGDRIDVEAGGRLRVARERMGGEHKQLRFWLHFVSMPVQVGAATSPQSMRSPLVVEW